MLFLVQATSVLHVSIVMQGFAWLWMGLHFGSCT